VYKALIIIFIDDIHKMQEKKNHNCLILECAMCSLNVKHINKQIMLKVKCWS